MSLCKILGYHHGVAEGSWHGMALVVLKGMKVIYKGHCNPMYQQSH